MRIACAPAPMRSTHLKVCALNTVPCANRLLAEGANTPLLSSALMKQACGQAAEALNVRITQRSAPFGTVTVKLVFGTSTCGSSELKVKVSVVVFTTLRMTGPHCVASEVAPADETRPARSNAGERTQTL